MKRPADFFTQSTRLLPDVVPPLTYPLHDDTLVVSKSGDINMAGFGSVRIARALVGEHGGIREDADGRWLVSFANIDLGLAAKGKPVEPITPNTLESRT